MRGYRLNIDTVNAVFYQVKFSAVIEFVIGKCGFNIFNYVFQSNYFYLCEKPSEVSLLEIMGPWPVYILLGDVIAFVMFWLLWLPFRKKA